MQLCFSGVGSIVRPVHGENRIDKRPIHGNQITKIGMVVWQN
jgi:hypothetical protein